MTHSQKVKEELCTARFACPKCGQAFVCGMLLFGEQSGEDTLFQCENKHIVEALAQEIVELTGLIASPKYDVEKSRKKHPVFCLELEKTEDVSHFYQMFDGVLHHQFDVSRWSKSCCKMAFLRGAFLACGVLVNPAKEYHLELKIRDTALAEPMYQFVQSCGLNLRLSWRKGTPVLYAKDSAVIEEILTLMGAPKNAMELMNIKILKEVRNNVNRAINCETANIQKSVRASMKQVEDIRFLLSRKRMSDLPEELQEVAKARLENPELSLSDLAAEIPSGISRSGLNHRLTRLSKLAQQLREEEREKEEKKQRPVTNRQMDSKEK